MKHAFLARAASIALAAASTLAAAGTLGGQDPIVIAHRGASGYLSEHTLAGYELAVQMGADYIEPDLQFTSDGVLVAMHDDTLDRTTNVESLFAPRNGGYRVSDFTLAEVKTLTVDGPSGHSYPGFTPSSPDPFRVPTFQEVITLAQGLSTQYGREVGIYPEAKQADPLMEDGILSTLLANGYGEDSKVYIQSFSDATIRSIDQKQTALGEDFALVVLGAAITLPDGTAMMGVLGGSGPGGVDLLPLAEVASFADGLGVVINTPGAEITEGFISQAHAAGLEVHGWTFGTADPQAAYIEFRHFLDMGMDGVFANYPDLAVAAVPEPSVAALMLLGGAGLLGWKRKRGG